MYENPFEQSLTGLEIKDWIWYNRKHQTKYTKMANAMGAFFNIDDNKLYMLTLCDDAPQIHEVEERGVKYEIPCDD